MFRKLVRALLPNRLDALCKQLARRKGSRILLAWNRGVGDIPLGLYAIVHRIRQFIPSADITWLVRKDLVEGFSLLRGIKVLAAPDWQRGAPYDVDSALASLGVSLSAFDLAISWPSPTEWVRWQYGTLVPRLAWDPAYDAYEGRFGLSPQFTYVGAQAATETNYGSWRDWPLTSWRELFRRLAAKGSLRVILFGMKREPVFEGEHIVDLRGRTTLLEALSIIKNRCQYLIAPDSGMLATTYYLDEAFPMRIVSLWADRNHGVLKQNVASPNPLLVHRPLFGAHRDLSTLAPDQVLHALFN